MAKFNQIAKVAEQVWKEVIGETLPSGEKVSMKNIVAVGDTILSSSTSTEQFYKVLFDRVTRTVFGSRTYTPSLRRNMLRDNIEWGVAVQKINIEANDFEDNPIYTVKKGDVLGTWKANPVTVMADIYVSTNTYQMSFTLPSVDVLRQSFTNEGTYTAFVSSIYTTVENKVAVVAEQLEADCICSYIADAYDYNFTPISGAGTQESPYVYNTDKQVAVNVLKVYNTTTGKTLTQKTCWYDKDFLKFSVSYINRIASQLKKMNILHNIKGLKKHTPADKLNLDINQFYADQLKYYLESDTYHNELVRLEKAGASTNEVSFWQKLGDGSPEDSMTVSLISGGGKDFTGDKAITGVFAVIRDTDACGTLIDRNRTDVAYDVPTDTTTTFIRADIGMFNARDEQFVVFVAQD